MNDENRVAATATTTTTTTISNSHQKPAMQLPTVCVSEGEMVTSVSRSDSMVASPSPTPVPIKDLPMITDAATNLLAAVTQLSPTHFTETTCVIDLTSNRNALIHTYDFRMRVLN